MIHSMSLSNVGPLREAQLERMASRINLFTGDNGLGKTFFLDVAWWAMTRRWPAYTALPGQFREPPEISVTYTTKGLATATECSQYVPIRESWSRTSSHSPFQGVAVYVRANGSFLLWDFERSQWREAYDDPETDVLSDLNKIPADQWQESHFMLIMSRLMPSLLENVAGPGRHSVFEFSDSEVWDGIEGSRIFERGETVKCSGLLHDWVLWQARNDRAWQRLVRALRVMSPSPDELLTPGPPCRMSGGGDRDIPTLQAPGGRSEPILLASSGVRRIVSLAYLLVWAWEEHERAAIHIGRKPTRQVVLLVDEIEAHLHPRWQRTILRTLLEVMSDMTGESIDVQVLATTHSPLVLASLEPHYDPERDALWKLDVVDGEVIVARDEWYRRGDANMWLTSDVFDMASSRSLEAEQAIERAKALVRDRKPALVDVRDVNKELGLLLSELDPFLVRWRLFVEQMEGAERVKGSVP